MRKLALLLIVAFSVLAIAQVPGATGSITGTVTDASNTLIPGVTVTAAGPTGTARTVTDAQGSYTFLGLAPGEYTVRANILGFLGSAVSISVGSGEAVKLGFALEVANAQSSIPIPPTPTPRSRYRISADRQTNQGNTILYRGNVQMTTDSTVLMADEMDFNTTTLTADARGNVKIQLFPSSVRVVPLSRK